MGQAWRDLPTEPESSGGARGAAPLEQVRSTVREYLEAFVLALTLALVMRTFVVQAYKIPSGSMEPTLLIGDHILVNKLAYGLRMPDSLFGLTLGPLPYGHYLIRFASIHRGDVIVFVYPRDRTKDFIKRVIGLSGDLVEVRGRAVFINGHRIADPHAHYVSTAPADEPGGFSSARDFGPKRVPPHKFFVMGDNRDLSYDSRFWGFVDRDDVEGRAFLIYWSWDGTSSSALPVRWSRIGKIVN